MGGKELIYIADAHSQGRLAGDGPYTKLCHEWIEQQTGTNKALLTHSCTAALEMAALLIDVQPGDEIIMPSYTFVSTANAFVLRGAVPVFVDIREDTLNLNEQLIEAAINERTKAIVPVHYAGVACEMDVICSIAKKHNLYVIEDAAQAVMSQYKGKALGSIGDMGTFSFHETKNVISGEGGALLVNNVDFSERAEVIREKGTDRSRFFRGQVDKYTWQEVGSSFLPGELISAFLWAQLEESQCITERRLDAWDYYHQQLESLERKDLLRRPIIPDGCLHNGHMYYILLNEEISRAEVIRGLQERDIHPVFHYIPLHSSPAGLKYGRCEGSMDITDRSSERLLRLPLWVGLEKSDQDKILEALHKLIK